jgi:nitric oxide reductase activation protein
VLYTHDGQPTDETPDEVAATVAALRRHGIVVLGVYVGPQDEIDQLQAIFGIDQTIPVARLTDLPARLGRLLLKYKRG